MLIGKRLLGQIILYHFIVMQIEYIQVHFIGAIGANGGGGGGGGGVGRGDRDSLVCNNNPGYSFVTAALRELVFFFSVGCTLLTNETCMLRAEVLFLGWNPAF